MNALEPRPDVVRELLGEFRGTGAFRRELERAWSAWSSQPSPIRATFLRRVHYRPFQGARLVGEAQYHPPGSHDQVGRQYYSVHIYPEADTAHQRLAEYLRKPALPCFGPPVHVVDQWHAVIFALPNGPRLRKLAWFLDPEGLRHLLQLKDLPLPAEAVPGAGIEVLRYVPRKRALLRYEVDTRRLRPRIYIKVFTKTDHPGALANHKLMARAWRRGQLGFAVPALLASSGKRRALFLEEVPGRLLTECYRPADEPALRAAGCAVASLHASAVRPRQVWSAEEEYGALVRAMKDLRAALRGLDPALGEVLQRLEKELPAVATFPPRPIHANLFGDQVLVGDAGIGIVDWDDLARGDPCFDVGRVLAHVLHCCARAGQDLEVACRVARLFLEGYVEAGGEYMVPARLRWHVAAALLMRAKISALRPLPQGWTEDVGRDLELAREVLAGGFESLL